MSRIRSVRIDRAVVTRLMAGERAAQELVYRAYADVVYSMALRVLGDSGLAEEATQDTFVDVIQGAAGLRRPEALSSWIRTIAVNHCLMRLRSPWHAKRDALPEDVRVVDGTERALDIETALRRLPAEMRMVVWMHCVEGYTHEEIGNAFGRTASFSKSKLARASRVLAVLAKFGKRQERRRASSVGRKVGRKQEHGRKLSTAPAGAS